MQTFTTMAYWTLSKDPFWGISLEEKNYFSGRRQNCLCMHGRVTKFIHDIWPTFGSYVGVLNRVVLL